MADPCVECDGDGVFDCEECGGGGTYLDLDAEIEETCDHCNGDGVIACGVCDGSGKEPEDAIV
jgi:DnaJ-class molecular chaperone